MPPNIITIRVPESHFSPPVRFLTYQIAVALNGLPPNAEPTSIHLAINTEPPYIKILASITKYSTNDDQVLWTVVHNSCTLHGLSIPQALSLINTPIIENPIKQTQKLVIPYVQTLAPGAYLYETLSVDVPPLP